MEDQKLEELMNSVRFHCGFKALKLNRYRYSPSPLMISFLFLIFSCLCIAMIIAFWTTEDYQWIPCAVLLAILFWITAFYIDFYYLIDKNEEKIFSVWKFFFWEYPLKITDFKDIECFRLEIYYETPAMLVKIAGKMIYYYKIVLVLKDSSIKINFSENQKYPCPFEDYEKIMPCFQDLTGAPSIIPQEIYALQQKKPFCSA